ncbi:MAG: hypothetical protein K6G03_05925 [Lachnospiraceae bacterium]|nr:hypothetical protein [Lachnospiraceae bacterium]
MNYCPKCEIVIRGNKNCCPLCQGKVTEVPKDKDNFETAVIESFPVMERKVSSFTFIKLVTFLFIALEICFGMLHMLLKEDAPWVSLVMLGIFVGWVDVLVTMYVRFNIIKLLTIEAYVASVINVYVDYMTGMHGWSLAWVVPSILFVLGILTIVIAEYLKLRPSEFVSYLALDTIVSLLQFIPIHYELNPIVLPAMICSVCYLILMAAILVFRAKDLKTALGRRFNF